MSKYDRLNTLHEQQLFNDDIKTLLSPIGQDGTVILNFDLHQSSFSVDKVHKLTEIIFEHLGEQFDGEILNSCSATSKPEQQNLIHLSYLSNKILYQPPNLIHFQQKNKGIVSPLTLLSELFLTLANH